MKILLFGQIYPDSFAKNISVTLEHMGHDIVHMKHCLSNPETVPFLKLLTYATRLSSKVEEHWFRAFVRQTEAQQGDLILNVGMHLPPRVVKMLKQKSRAPLVIWFPDHLVNFWRQYIMASDYDAFFFKDRHIVEFFRDKLGKQAFFLPEACNPIWHRRVELKEEEKRFYGCDLTLAGNMYYYRALLLEHFLDHDFKVWGANYPRWLDSPVKSIYTNHYVAELEKAKSFNAAKIIVNTMHYGEILGVNARAFEAAGCGAFQILDWKPNMDEFFQPEREVVTFRTLAELKEKVRYYLEHDKERQDIADRAYERAHKEHTYEHRLKRLLELTFGSNSDAE